MLAELTYKCRRGLIRGMRRKGGFSFVPGGTLTPEETFLNNLQLAGTTVYDVGGWEGVYTLFFARAVGPDGNVITFEPNPANRDRIAANLQLNNIRNVTVRPYALGNASTSATLVVDDGIAGEGHVATGTQSAAEAQTRGRSAVAIEVRPLDSDIATGRLPQPHLVKMDVEGFELKVLEGMAGTLATARPRLFIEVHQVPERPTHSAEVISYLLEREYTLRHIESGQSITRPEFQLAHSDHVYAE